MLALFIRCGFRGIGGFLRKQMFSRGHVRLIDLVTIVRVFGTEEHQEEDSNPNEGAKNHKLLTPAVFVGDVSTNDWAKRNDSESDHVVQDQALASLVDLLIVSPVKIENTATGPTK